ncbi:MAG: hydroxymethylglutaryl-CoA lyase [Gemmatimonadetes bacterium]|nr:hydroxymethylglutaryl-CoA lyase [Gemmatimonadota bacterium]
MVVGRGSRVVSHIRLVEVGPRDGLQSISGFVPTDVKVAYIDALSRTGLSDIEVSSFVSPKWVPQLADAEEVFRCIERRRGVRYHALVPNLEGLERAVAARVDVVAVFTAASETFSRKNTNASIADTLERFAPVISASPVPVRGYVSTAFVCPFEGPVAPKMVRQVAIALTALGCQEISLGDTIGKATPDQVRRLLEIVLPDVPADRIALHCHDTFGQAVANVQAAAELGVRVFDGSAGGIGGCPYAPGAPGNVSTEALVRAFPGLTGVDPEALAAAGRMITTAIQESGTSL